jgi:hypothetical protein
MNWNPNRHQSRWQVSEGLPGCTGKGSELTASAQKESHLRGSRWLFGGTLNWVQAGGRRETGSGLPCGRPQAGEPIAARSFRPYPMTDWVALCNCNRRAQTGEVIARSSPTHYPIRVKKFSPFVPRRVPTVVIERSVGADCKSRQRVYTSVRRRPAGGVDWGLCACYRWRRNCWVHQGTTWRFG